MSVVTLTINGELVSAREGETLLQVLHEQNIAIPTLCHLEGLSDRGACRLCMVELEGTHGLPRHSPNGVEWPVRTNRNDNGQSLVVRPCKRDETCQPPLNHC